MWQYLGRMRTAPAAVPGIPRRWPAASQVPCPTYRLHLAIARQRNLGTGLRWQALVRCQSNADRIRDTSEDAANHRRSCIIIKQTVEGTKVSNDGGILPVGLWTLTCCALKRKNIVLPSMFRIKKVMNSFGVYSDASDVLPEGNL